MQKIILFLLFCFIPFFNYGQKEFILDTFRLHVNSSFRGLSVVNDQVIWLSGSNGYIFKSINGGQTFDSLKISGYESYDFRDIEAFDEKTAVVMSSGTPAVFLRTNDGGIKWKLVYKNDHKKVFFNGMDFWDDKKGLAFSDPIDGKIFLISTNNGGAQWKEVPFETCPQSQDGETGFAASGTSIRTVGDGYAFIGTGGRAAHIFASEDYGKTWKKFSCPIVRGGESAGIFSVAFKDSRTGVIIGGDYKNDTLKTNMCFLTYNGGRNWKAPLQGPGGYRSCVEYINQTATLSTGPSGTEFSRDGGNTWKKISSTGYNVARKSKKGNSIFLAGSNGTFGILTRY